MLTALERREVVQRAKEALDEEEHAAAAPGGAKKPKRAKAAAGAEGQVGLGKAGWEETGQGLRWYCTSICGMEGLFGSSRFVSRAGSLIGGHE